MNIEVTSVNRKEQKLARTAAAVFVISREDIRRSGATNIPDVLRMAPGVQVSQIDANAWAISIRGFNTRYSNKVLVLIDGRTVYSSSFSGVFWDQQSVPLEDIDHIEVIRGPGGTVWGANAVNGVINIITKPAQATQGGLVSAGTGNESQATGLVRYGGPAGRDGAYRIFGQYTKIDGAALPDGIPAADGWRRIQGGFRTDWNFGPRDTLMVEGSAYSNSAGQNRWPGFTQVFGQGVLFADTITARGGDLTGRWDHTFAGGSDTSLQVFAAAYRRVDFGSPETNKTLDFDFQHHIAWGSRQDIVWGLGYRATNSGLGPQSPAFVPTNRIDSLYSTFFQDQIQLTNSLWLTVGSKLEHNAYTGIEYEPSASLAWTPTSRNTLWMSAARAIRQPSRLDADINVTLDSTIVPPGIPLTMVLLGNPHFKAERVEDFEAGYRAQLSHAVSLDLTAFASRYPNLQSYEWLTSTPVPNPLAPGLLLSLMMGNGSTASNFGGEVSANWNVNSRWTLSSLYSYLRFKVNVDPSIPDGSGDGPKHMAQFHSLFNLTRHLEFDNALYYISRLSGNNLPGRVRLDTRLGWKAGERWEFSIAGQNLLRPQTLEFGDTSFAGTEVQRSIYAKVTWRF